MATNAYTRNQTLQLGEFMAPFILRVKEYVQPKRQLIRLTYTHEKHPVRTAVLLQITKETFTMYKNRQECKEKIGGTEMKSIQAKLISVRVSKAYGSEIGGMIELRGAEVDVDNLHEYGGYSNMWTPHTSAESIQVTCITEEGGMYDTLEEDEWGDPASAPFGLDVGRLEFINDILFIDPKTKRIDTRAPMIDGWKLDIKYMGYD